LEVTEHDRCRVEYGRVRDIKRDGAEARCHECVLERVADGDGSYVSDAQFGAIKYA